LPNISSGKQQILVDELNRCDIIMAKLLASPFGSSPVDLAIKNLQGLFYRQALSFAFYVCLIRIRASG
jgi:hypothetical protein